MECGRLPLKCLTVVLLPGIYSSLCNPLSSRVTKVPTDLLQVNGLCLRWLGCKTMGLLCLWFFSHPCSEESSYHAVTFPMERTVRQELRAASDKGQREMRTSVQHNWRNWMLLTNTWMSLETYPSPIWAFRWLQLLPTYYCSLIRHP